MATTTINQLSSLVATLYKERDQHVAAIAEIDEAFARLGLNGRSHSKRSQRTAKPRTAAGRARRAGKGRRKRGTFKTTANELILSSIKKAGPKGATGAQLTEAWQADGRPGDAYNTLSILTRAKKIKRHRVSGERGSRYRIRG
jgi:hypothetical protein